MTKKFVNAIVPVFHADHITAVINEAQRLGYRVDRTCPLYEGGTFVGNVKCIHLENTGKIYAYIGSSAEDLIDYGYPRELYRDAVLLIKLRKLRGLDVELNKTEVVTCSRDNQSALVVRPKCIVVASVSGRVQMVQPNLCTDLRPCHNAGLVLHDIKTCTMSRAYGGTCTQTPSQRRRSYSAQFTASYGSTEFPTLTKDTQEDNSKVVWVRPKAENPIVSKVVVWSVLTISKIVSVVKRVIKSIQGGK